MKAVIFVLMLSCILIDPIRSAATFTVTNAGEATLVGTGSFVPGTGTTITTPTSGTAATQAPVTALTYTGGFTGGYPATATTYVGTNDQAATNTFLIVLKLGQQVGATVTSGTSTGATAITYSAASSQTSALTTAACTCGQYVLDCAAGTLTMCFQLAAGNTAVQNCGYSVVQVAVIAGVLQFATSGAPASPYTTLNALITASNSATSPVTVVCGSATSGTNTNLFFTSTYGSTSATADQLSASNKIKLAASLGALSSNTAYYVTQLPTSSSGGTTAPSTTLASSLTTVSKSQSRIVVVAGLLTTVVATLFGFAL